MSVAMFKRRVDPGKLALRGARLTGDLPLEFLPRVAALLVDGAIENFVKADILFSAGKRGQVSISGQVDACLNVRCQRCLEPVCIPVTAQLRLVVQGAHGRAGVIADGYELLEADEQGVVPAELIEEELLLALPMVAAHEAISDCGELVHQLNVPEPESRAKHPFAVLKDLQLK